MEPRTFIGKIALTVGILLQPALGFAEEATRSGEITSWDSENIERLDSSHSQTKAFDGEFKEQEPIGCTEMHCDPPYGGWSGGGEFLYLRQFHPDPLFSRDADFKPAFRVWLGFQREDGLGIRLRYFQYDHDLPTIIGSTNAGPFRQQVIDLEAIDTFQLGSHWATTIGLGIRHTDYSTRTEAFFPGFPSSIISYAKVSGTGPVLSVDLYREVTTSLSLYGLGRASLLVDTDGQTSNFFRTGMTYSMLELQIGLQYNVPRSKGGVFFTRAGWETQIYEDITLTGNSGLSGLSFAVGVLR